jgi:hypothetical protein
VVWRSGLFGGPPDSVQCTRTVQVQTRHSQVFPASLHYNSPDCPMCRRTVRCTSGATTLWHNGRLHSAPNSATVHGRNQSRGQRRTGQWTVPVRCNTRLSGATRSQRSNGRLRQNPNGWVTWLAHQTVSGAPIDSSLPQQLFWWVTAINTPQPPPLQLSKHSTLLIQYKSKVQHSKTQIKATDLIEVPNSILVL